MAKMKITPRRIAELTLDPKNARKHGEESIRSKREILLKFGQQRPIVIDAEDIVRAGNGFTLAAQSLGWEWIDTVKTSLTGPELIAYAIADNRTGELSEWDDAVLSEILADFAEVDSSLFESTGFSEKDLAELLESCKAEPEIVEDDTPEVPADPVTKPGDLWLLGDHRLLCGDSTKPEYVARLMDGETADLCFTSPPYGQQRHYTKESDCSDWDKLMQGVFANLPMSDTGQVLVNLGMIHRECEWMPYWDGWIEWMRSQGWRRFGWYVWDQGFGLPGDWNGRFGPSHEFVFHFNKNAVRPLKWVDKQPENVKPRNAMESTMRRADGKTVAFTNPSASAQATKVPDSVIRIGRQVGSDGHPAQFPVQFASAILLSWSGSVYDPFLGSGSTLIAAEQLRRRCFGIEISPAYCDVIIARWEKLTGKKAVHFGSGVVSS